MNPNTGELRRFASLAAIAAMPAFESIPRELDMPLKIKGDLLGRDLRISHGLGGRSDLVLATSKVKKFRVNCAEGGTTVVGFQVQCNTDVSEKVCGKLCALEGEEIEATLTASEEAPSDKPLAAVGAGEKPALTDAEGKPWPFPKGKEGQSGPDATDAFVDAHAGQAS